jgi:hypothetical protein
MQAAHRPQTAAVASSYVPSFHVMEPHLIPQLRYQCWVVTQFGWLEPALVWHIGSDTGINYQTSLV